MTFPTLRLLAAGCLAIFVSIPDHRVAAEEPANLVTYGWDDFSLEYPAGRWRLKVVGEEESSACVMIAPFSEYELTIRLILSRGFPKADAHYLNNPQMLNTSVILAPALELADNDESKIYLTQGSANLHDYWYTTARGMVLVGDGRAIHLEGIHDLNDDTGRAWTALLTTSSAAGQVNQDPAYTALMIDMYQIVRSIRIRPRATE